MGRLRNGEKSNAIVLNGIAVYEKMIYSHVGTLSG